MEKYDIFGNPNDNKTITEQVLDSEYIYPLATSKSKVEEDRLIGSFPGFQIMLFLMAAVLSFQCFHLQVVQGVENRSLAVGNSVRIITIQADRGLITASDGTILAQNTRKLALAINPQTLPLKMSDRKKVYQKLQSIAGISQATISFIEENRLLTPNSFVIKANLSQDQSLIYEEKFVNTPGVIIQESPIREYTPFTSSGQLLGYVGDTNALDIKNGFTPDEKIGKGGLEESYNQQLMGTPGILKAEIDAYGTIVRQLPDLADNQPKPGDTLQLSLNLNLQKIVANALISAVEQRAKTYGKIAANLGASAVILDPTNGAILAMVSLPDYDANLFASGISSKNYAKLINNPADPLLNRTIQGQFPSGSVIKPIIAATALQDGVINLNRVLNTPAALTIGQYTFPDWRLHGLSNIEQAIAQSNDIFFYALGGGWPSQNIAGLGIDKLNKGLNEFGLGSPTEVDLPGEVSGLTPGPNWKEKTYNQPWYIGDTYHQSIGQGYLLVTPLQMAVATAAIANGGTLYQPQLGWSLTNPTTNHVVLLPHKVLNRNWISPENIKIVQTGMEMTTEPGGTAQLLAKLNVKTAGKTGTAEFGTDGLTHSWYTGYAPVDNPKYAFAILIEGDGKVTEATESSEPVAEEILRGIFNEPLLPGQALLSQALFPTLPTNSITSAPSPPAKP